MAILCVPSVDAQEFGDAHGIVSEHAAIELMRSGQPVQAHSILQRLLNHSNIEEVQQRIEYNAGIAAYHSGNLLQAQQHWENVVERDEHHSYAKQNIDAVTKEIEHRNALQNQDPKPPRRSNNSAKKMDKKSASNNQDERQQKMKENGNEGDSSVPQEWSKARAKRFIEQVQEGQFHTEYKGFGNQEKAW